MNSYKRVFYIAAGLAGIILFLPGCSNKRIQKANLQDHPRGKILTGVLLNEVLIRDFPRYNKSGEKWDAFAPLASNPDVYCQILWNDNLIFKSESIEESQHGQILTYQSGLPVRILPFDQPLLLEVFDEDGISGDDNIGYMKFDLKDYTDWKQVDLESGELKVSLKLEWIYE